MILEQEANGLVLYPGICHRWSSTCRENSQTGTFPYIMLSKLLWALAYGDSSLYFVTEKEEALADWIVSQNVRSVSLQSVFRESYRLNSGDVYLSLLTATNVFSRFWSVADRETLALSTRLQVITAEQEGEGDNYGAWHHFWGMVLFGYCHGEANAELVGWIESMGSQRVESGDEVDEKYINRYAGVVGAELREKVFARFNEVLKLGR